MMIYIKNGLRYRWKWHNLTFQISTKFDILNLKFPLKNIIKKLGSNFENIETFFDIKYVFHKRSWHKKQSNFSNDLYNFQILKFQRLKMNCPVPHRVNNAKTFFIMKDQIFSIQKLVRYAWINRVYIVSEYDREIRSPSFSMKLPSVISLKQFIKPSEYANFTRFNVLISINRNSTHGTWEKICKCAM